MIPNNNINNKNTATSYNNNKLMPMSLLERASLLEFVEIPAIDVLVDRNSTTKPELMMGF